MRDSYKENRIIFPSINWEEGVLIIMFALKGLPPDFEEWNIRFWEETIKLSKKAIELESKKVL